MVDLAYSIADQNVATTKSIGIYNLSLHLLRQIGEQSQLERLTVFSNRTVTPSLQPSAKVRVVEFNRAIDRRFGRILWDQWGVYRAARASGNPWLFLPKGFCSFVLRPPVRVAAYVHDIMGDYYRRRYPGFWPKLESLYFSRSLTATMRRADIIFTNTEFSRGEIIGLAQRIGLRTPKVIVAGYGFTSPERHRVEKENRVLLIASKWPHKRTDIAVRFLQHWLQTSKYDGVIDCIGILSPEMEKPSGPNWSWGGRVSPVEVRQMMRRARAVIYVSEYEGFGMPPVEAVMDGTCPVFSDIPPLREVMGDAGCPFTNESKESFVQAMNSALSASPETIKSWSEKLLRRHNWQSVTEKILPELSTN